MIRVQRVAVGLGLTGLILGLLWVEVEIGGSVISMALLIGLLCGALRELLRMMQRAGMQCHAKTAVIGSAALLCLRAASEPLGLTRGEAREVFLAGLGALALIPLIRAVGSFRADDEGLAAARARIYDAANTALALLYVTFLGSYLLELRLLDVSTPHDVSGGLALVVLVVTAVKFGDSCAYFVGRSIGKRKLSPVSPKKTWEGSVASIIGSVASAVMIGSIFEWDARLMAGLGVIVNLAGQGGDLVESLLKRALGSKDSSTKLGEIGGALDMADALLLSAPAAYLWSDLLLQRY